MDVKKQIFYLFFNIIYYGSFKIKLSRNPHQRMFYMTSQIKPLRALNGKCKPLKASHVSVVNVSLILNVNLTINLNF